MVRYALNVAPVCPPQDIIDSTMGNMGYAASESYGLTWKVRGLCTKTGELENVDIFDSHQVYGDIKNSDIYGAYYRLLSGQIEALVQANTL